MKGEISNMSDGADSTSVDNSKNNQYESDIKNGVPRITMCCQSIEPNGRGTMEIVVGPEESGRNDGDGISLYGGAIIKVYPASKEQLAQIKEALMKKQRAQEEALNVAQEEKLTTSEVEK